MAICYRGKNKTGGPVKCNINCEPSALGLAELKISGKIIVQQIDQKRKILQCCWRGQPMSALRAVTNKLLSSEVVVLGPCSVPGCSTHHLEAAKPRKLRSGSAFLAALKSVENISWARYCCVFHERGGFKLEEPMARCLGFYWCKQEWLSFPICKIIQASWAMGFWMLSLTDSVVLLQWDRRKYLTVPIKGKKKKKEKHLGVELKPSKTYPKCLCS